MAMSKKNYEKAAAIVRAHRSKALESRTRGPYFAPHATQALYSAVADGVEEAFVILFSDDNPSYDVSRFRAACRKNG